MIRTRISALAPVRGLAGILSDDLCNVLNKGTARMIGHDGGCLARLPANHVLVEEANDSLLLGLVFLEDVLCAEKPDFFGSVKVEFNSVFGLPALRGGNTEGLENHGATGGVVVGTGGPGIGATGRAVKVGAENDHFGVLTG